MIDHVNLEIRLDHHPEANHYWVEATLRRPGSAPQEKAAVAEFDLQGLADLALAGDNHGYGKKLADCLFGPNAIQDLFSRACQAAEDHEPPLPMRFRLRVGPGALELQELRWELIHGPEDTDQLLTTDENRPFSRYLISPYQRPVRTRPQAGIKALVVIANPDDLALYKLAPVNVLSELKRVRKGLGGIPLDALCRCDDHACDELEANIVGLPTLTELLKRLRDGYDILYLVAHGTLPEKGEAQLFLEDKDGRVEVVAASDFRLPGSEPVLGLGSQLSHLIQLPRLVVLASCESAGTGEAEIGMGAGHEEEAELSRRDARALAALGPHLADAGVPAVVAMQGCISMGTVEGLMPFFFEELLRDGHIDRAMAAARREVKEHPDWWMPVVYSRLDDGLLFSPRGQAVSDEPKIFWDRLVESIGKGKCVPILGAGITGDFLPSLAVVAQTLAEKRGYSLPYDDNLARVGQFIATHGYADMCEDVVQELIEGFERRMGLQPKGLESLADTIEDAGWIERVQTLPHNEIHHQLADFNLPLYVTTNFDNFMTMALRAKRPEGERHRVRREAMDWRKECSDEEGRTDADLKPKPSRQDPVVYHLFGTDQDLLSMVLTEDHYLDYLARIFRDHQALLPAGVKAQMARSSLLFLGYDLHDLALKVILRGLLATLDGLKRFDKKHVAVQIEPTTVDQAHRENVIDYVKRYFARTAEVQIDVYWGSAHQFVSDLHSHWQEKQES